MVTPLVDPLHYFDRGHHGDVDVTLIDKLLAMTPTERLRHHERWRSLLKGSTVWPEFLDEVVKRLGAVQADFIIVGGVSGVLQGASIITRDVDLCYRRTPENIQRIVAALQPLNPRPRGFPPDLPFEFDERTVQFGSNFTLDIGGEALDLLGDMAGIGGYEQVIGDAVDLVVAGVPVKVLSLSQLIQTKTAAGRTKDLAALPDLKAALERTQKHDSSQP